MRFYYTYKINFVDGFYYYGSRESTVKPEDDFKYTGSPVTHKDKWKTTMFYKTILCVYGTLEECGKEEINLIRPVFKTDPFCLNEACGKIVNMTPEIRKKMSDAAKGRVYSEEYKQRMSEIKKGKPGKPHTEETKQKISAVKKGKPMSEETKQKLSETNKGRTHSEETKEKIKRNHKGNTGRNLSTEHKQNIGQAQKGRTRSEETRRKISEANKGNTKSKGIKRSAETKQRMSEAAKKRWAIKRELDELPE